MMITMQRKDVVLLPASLYIFLKAIMTSYCLFMTFCFFIFTFHCKDQSNDIQYVIKNVIEYHNSQQEDINADRGVIGCRGKLSCS